MQYSPDKMTVYDDSGTAGTLEMLLHAMRFLETSAKIQPVEYLY